MPQVILTAPLREETRGKINTFKGAYSWMAWRDGRDECAGFGETEAEAIADLLEKERTCPTS